MIALAGTYQNGQVILDKELVPENPVRVIVTFLEDIEIGAERVLSLSDFSFSKSQKALEHYKGSFSDALIEERRSAI